MNKTLSYILRLDFISECRERVFHGIFNKNFYQNPSKTFIKNLEGFFLCI